MRPTTLSARDFNQDLSRAKKAALQGPVIITDRGRPAHVLLSIDHYRHLTQGRQSLADSLAMPEAAELELPLVLARELGRSAEF